MNTLLKKHLSEKDYKREKLSEKDYKREKRIVSKLNISKLPFNISAENFCIRYTEMFRDMKPVFLYEDGDSAMKWCFSTSKRMRIFLLIFEANEAGTEIYKENISSLLPEYSYKTVAQIIDEGVAKEFFEKLAPRNMSSKDSKIRNIRPSEELVIEFINWNIEVISTLTNFLKKNQ